MGQPVFGSPSPQKVAHLFQGFRFHEPGEQPLRPIVQACQLGDADVREISRPHPEETPMAFGRRRKFEFVFQVLVFFYHVFGIGIDGKFLQEPGLPEKESFYLEQVVPVLVDRSQRYRFCPQLERIGIDPESEITRQGDKESMLPIPVACLQALLDLSGFASNRSIWRLESQLCRKKADNRGISSCMPDTGLLSEAVRNWRRGKRDSAAPFGG